MGDKMTEDRPLILGRGSLDPRTAARVAARGATSRGELGLVELMLSCLADDLAPIVSRPPDSGERRGRAVAAGRAGAGRGRPRDGGCPAHGRAAAA